MATDLIAPSLVNLQTQSADAADWRWMNMKRFVRKTVESPAGFYFYFPASEAILLRVFNFIRAENQRLQGWVFTLQVQEDLVLLEISGPEEVKPAIRSMMRN